MGLPDRDRKSPEKIIRIAELAGESAYPTLAHKNLRSSGAGASACQPIFSRASKTKGAGAVLLDKQLRLVGERARCRKREAHQLSRTNAARHDEIHLI